jgi:diphthamide synthase (EF-2-diphthine--ammonia ligase)
LQPHKDWEDKVCAAASLKAILPLWQQDQFLVNQMLENGCNHDCFLQYNDGEQYLGKF